MGDTRQDLWHMIHPRPHREHLFRSSVPETPTTCRIPWGAQQPRTMGS